MNEKEYSPFTPGSPVPVDLFVGRSGQIKEVIRYINELYPVYIWLESELYSKEK